jgi:predicted nucleotide-binding protein
LILSRSDRLLKQGVGAHLPEFVKWHRDAEAAIARTYGNDSPYLKRFRAIPFDFEEPGVEQYVPGHWDEHNKRVATANALLTSMREEAAKEARQHSNRVFVVHGRDLGAKETVARCLTKLGLDPVILHEQPNTGRTIVEKFESFSDVGFSVILLTADDFGRLKAEEILQPRARQNVIFEFGYFVGKIGRGRVCALMEAGVEKPSDLDGVVYVRLGLDDAWTMQLVKELKAAGYDVDANKVL